MTIASAWSLSAVGYLAAGVVVWRRVRRSALLTLMIADEWASPLTCLCILAWPLVLVGLVVVFAIGFVLALAETLASPAGPTCPIVEEPTGDRTRQDIDDAVGDDGTSREIAAIRARAAYLGDPEGRG